MIEQMKKLEDAIEKLRKDIAEFQDLVADPRILMKPAVTEKCPCKKHRSYKAILAPRVSCPECQAYYERKHP